MAGTGVSVRTGEAEGSPPPVGAFSVIEGPGETNSMLGDDVIVGGDTEASAVGRGTVGIGKVAGADDDVGLVVGISAIGAKDTGA